MGAQGTATIDFGLAPGTNIVSVAVTGQATIASNSFAEAFFQGNDSTASHNAYEHMIAPQAITLSCSNFIAGTGFTINAITQLRVDGTFTVRWVWN
jgi:hypothetical protein